ncbi:hypothetical protein ACTFIW_012061 [Dictyostelium discoideum]
MKNLTYMCEIWDCIEQISLKKSIEINGRTNKVNVTVCADYHCLTINKVYMGRTLLTYLCLWCYILKSNLGDFIGSICKFRVAEDNVGRFGQAKEALWKVSKEQEVYLPLGGTTNYNGKNWVFQTFVKMSYSEEITKVLRQKCLLTKLYKTNKQLLNDEIWILYVLIQY